MVHIPFPGERELLQYFVISKTNGIYLHWFLQVNLHHFTTLFFPDKSDPVAARNAAVFDIHFYGQVVPLYIPPAAFSIECAAETILARWLCIQQLKAAGQ